MFRISDAIRHTETSDGGILLDIQRGQMFCLNLVGAKIVRLLEQGRDEASIVEEISRQYRASKEVVSADVRGFIEMLRKQEILQRPKTNGIL